MKKPKIHKHINDIYPKVAIPSRKKSLALKQKQHHIKKSNQNKIKQNKKNTTEEKNTEQRISVNRNAMNYCVYVYLPYKYIHILSFFLSSVCSIRFDSMWLFVCFYFGNYYEYEMERSFVYGMHSL